MRSFEYHRPESLEEAVSLQRLQADSVFLAGGQTLIPAMKQSLAAPAALIDLGGVAELTGIDVRDGAVVVGAMTRHADVAASAELGRAIPALARLAGLIGDPQVRNCGTLGGSLANSDPAADYPAGVLGLAARIHTDRRRIEADAFFLDLFETALEEDELIVNVEFQIPARAAYRKFPHPASRYALAGVMVAELDGRIRVAVTGAGPCAFRATSLEEALERRFAPDALGDVVLDDSGYHSDLHGSAEYRAQLVRVMAARAVADMLAT